ncbi:hypothetical protein [Thermoflavifilum thermophilum]|uniref:Thioredoxin domain-containing protein n=1 Tax=Thermoflavifilum thermophilum TaxID=1393122 RepID=A0A1I7N8N2_9BACT|nr:hypothetical protein [Thermoflavifilum thermophilum]SFV30998.1 hypothetical protein SAMN05660895_0950 [Thermoflavifilum thermophilum]
MKPLFFISLFLMISMQLSAQQQSPKVLTGPIQESMLANDPAFPWFYLGVNAYQPDSLSLARIREQKDLFQVVAFIGTWDSVTMRVLPAFFKTMILTGYPLNQLTIYGLDEKLNGAERWKKKYAIQTVPTFVILKGKQTLGILAPPFTQPIEVSLAHLLQPPAE